MDDHRKWHLAWAQFHAFKRNLPSSVAEKHVAEFHAILDLLQEASGEDVSSFRIPDDELKPQKLLPNFRIGRLRHPVQRAYTKEKYCNRRLMSQKLDALHGYFQAIQPPPQEPEKPKYGY